MDLVTMQAGFDPAIPDEKLPRDAHRRRCYMIPLYLSRVLWRLGSITISVVLTFSLNIYSIPPMMTQESPAIDRVFSCLLRWWWAGSPAL